MKLQSSFTAATLRVQVETDILSTNAEGYRQEIFRLATAAEREHQPWRTLEIDLTRARMIDSMGLNLLVAVIKFAKERQVAVRLLVAHKSLARILRFTRLDQLADVQGVA